MGIAQSAPESKLSNHICCELAKLDHVGLLTNDEVMTRGYHAFHGDPGSSTNECDILINPITIKINSDQFPFFPSIEIKIKQDVRTYSGSYGWTYHWARNKFKPIDPANSKLTSQQVREINYGIDMANKKIIHPPWFDKNQCKKLNKEVKNHPIQRSQ